MYKVERKPADPKSSKYEVMLSPFKTHKQATAYIKKYEVYYPTNERNYIVTKI